MSSCFIWSINHYFSNVLTYNVIPFDPINSSDNLRGSCSFLFSFACCIFFDSHHDIRYYNTLRNWSYRSIDLHQIIITFVGSYFICQNHCEGYWQAEFFGGKLVDPLVSLQNFVLTCVDCYLKNVPLSHFSGCFFLFLIFLSSKTEWNSNWQNF